MITRSKFFEDLAKGALWDVGVAINRTNPLPLDKFSVFGAYSDGEGDNDTTTALGYAKNSVIAYPGQIIAVVAGTDEAPVTTVYVIKKTGTGAELETLGSSSDISKLTTRVSNLETKAVTNVNGVNAIKAIKIGNAVTLATETSAVEGNILEVKDDGLYVPTPEAVTVPEYSIVKDATSSDYAAVYHLTKDNVNTGVAINIPKDKFLKSVTLEHYEAGKLPAGVTAPGTYLKFVFENITDPVYLNVNEFLDGVIYTGGTDSKGSGKNVYSTIQVNIDPTTHVITASILDGGVHTAELADRAVTGTKIGLKAVATENIANDAITATQIASGAISTDKIADNAVTADKINDGEIGTAKLADGAVTDAKLHQGVKDSLAKANSAVQSVALESGTKNGTVKLTVDGTSTDNIAVTGLGTAAYEAKGAFDAAGAAAAVLGDSTTDTAESNTVYGVKKKSEANATAITELQNGKVDKLEASIPGLNSKVYAVSPTGDQIGLGTVYGDALDDNTWSYGGGTVVLADEGTGTVPVTTPTKGYHAANKKYVDDAVNTAVSSGITVETTGKGKYVTAVTKTNGKISVTKGTPTVDLSELTDTTNILDSKANAADLDQAKTDLTGTIDQVKTDLTTEIGKKQDALSFEGEPSKTNKVVTKSAMDSAISTATAGLTGAMHFVGNSTSDPLGESGPTITGHTGAFKSGDVCTYNKKEFVYDGTSWRELGDEGSYIVQGTKFTDTDIADKANIAQSKIAGLTNDIEAAKKLAVIYDQFSGGPISGFTPDGLNTTLHYAKEYTGTGECAGGIVAVSPNKDNGIKIAVSGEITVANVTTDIIKNGTKTLILNGGGAAL